MRAGMPFCLNMIIIVAAKNWQWPARWLAIKSQWDLTLDRLLRSDPAYICTHPIPRRSAQWLSQRQTFGLLHSSFRDDAGAKCIGARKITRLVWVFTTRPIIGLRRFTDVSTGRLSRVNCETSGRIADREDWSDVQLAAIGESSRAEGVGLGVMFIRILIVIRLTAVASSR